jgi:hypothetical protein
MANVVKFLMMAALALVIVPMANAQQDSQSSMKASDAVDPKDKAKAELGENDPDNLLTNAKLRAESGSKSRFSIASTLGYLGGSVSHPFGDSRPNIQGANGVTDVTDIEGGINFKYNITPRDSILLGEVVRFVTPFGSLSTVPNGYPGQKVDSYAPQLLYQRIYKSMGLQSYFQVGPGWETRTDFTKHGYLGNLSIYNVNAYDIGKSRFTVGVESGLTYSWFKSPKAYGSDEGYTTANETASNYTDYALLVYPYLEYKITDRFNIRTVSELVSLEHTMNFNGNYNVWKKDVALQSVGIGISVTRDIFLYPNIQFVPDHSISATRTNFALNTDINLF